MIVTVAVAGTASVAPLVGSVSARVKVWGPVTTRSRRIGTLTSCVVCPAANVTLPVGAV